MSDLKNPGRPLVEKLGVKAGYRIGFEDFSDPALEVLLRGCEAELDAAPPLDLLLFHVAEPAALGRLPELRARLAEAGAIWVIREKGPGRTVTEIDIIEAARAARLVDNKIASYSESLAAMRLVIPLKLRGR